MGRAQKINLVTAIVLFGFVASVAFHYFKAAYFQLFYPHDTFLFVPHDRFNDFFHLYEYNQFRHPYFEDPDSNQYPFLNLIVYCFTWLSEDTAIIAYTLLVILLFAWVNAINVQLYDIRLVGFCLLSYPFIFAIDRGNLECLVFVFLALFIYYYQRNNRFACTFWLSCAIAMKMAPVVFLVLFISEKRYRDAGRTIAMALLLTLLSLCTFRGGFVANAAYILRGANIGNSAVLSYVVGSNHMVQRGVSLFTAAKVVLNLTHWIRFVDMALFLQRYKLLMGAGFVLLTIYILLVEMEAWQKVTLLTVAMLVFPHISSDYKLLHVYIPLYLLINTAKPSRRDLGYIVMFSLLLIPKDYYLLPRISSDSGVYDISIAVLLNPAILVGMMTHIILDGFRRVRPG